MARVTPLLTERACIHRPGAKRVTHWGLTLLHSLLQRTAVSLSEQQTVPMQNPIEDNVCHNVDLRHCLKGNKLNPCLPLC